MTFPPTFGGQGDIKGVSQRLVQVSKSRGSNDNISVLVVFLKEPGGISRSRVSGRGGDGMEVFPDIYLNQNGKVQPPGGPVPAAVSPQPPVSQQHYDEEDFGPETDVDSVDDVLLSPSIAAAKAMASQSPVPGLGKVWVPHQKLQQQQENWLKTLPWSYADAVRNPAKKPPTKPQPEVAVVEPKEEHRPVEDDDVRPIREDTPPPTVQDIRKERRSSIPPVLDTGDYFCFNLGCVCVQRLPDTWRTGV
ncbi:hypothetical protein AAG570_000754 [Ranatra chinensis]|uniref:Uncharacterized protein n=1 Tax=Ranatra chinensis TaxID=642074 RepID=A0ABD0YYN7_9HEMI